MDILLSAVQATHSHMKTIIFDQFTDVQRDPDKNTTKLFDENEVGPLAFRKYAMLAGLSGLTEHEMLAQGKKLWEEEYV